MQTVPSPPAAAELVAIATLVEEAFGDVVLVDLATAELVVFAFAELLDCTSSAREVAFVTAVEDVVLAKVLDLVVLPGSSTSQESSVYISRQLKVSHMTSKTYTRCSFSTCGQSLQSSLCNKAAASA